MCHKEFTVTAENCKKFRLEGHCFGCSSDYRSVLRKSSNPEIRAWFIGLRITDPDQYRKLSLNYLLSGTANYEVFTRYQIGGR